jgi:hypothetical protein
MQDAYVGVCSCANSRVGRDLVWKFLQKEWTKLVERFGEKSSFLVTFVEVIDKSTGGSDLNMTPFLL